MLVIDGKYNSEDGRIRRIKSLGDSEVKAQEEQHRGERAQQSSRYRSSQRRRKTKIESPLDLIQKFRQPSDRTGAARGLPSGKAKVKSQKEG
jgi:hypothetical protein